MKLFLPELRVYMISDQGKNWLSLLQLCHPIYLFIRKKKDKNSPIIEKNAQTLN